YWPLTCGVATTVVTPSEASVRSTSSLSARSAGPSSRPGRTCAWMSTIPSTSGGHRQRCVEVLAGPQLDVQGAPDRAAGGDLAGAVAPQQVARRGDVDEAAVGERLRGEDVLGELADSAAQPARLGGHEAELVGAVAHHGRKHVGKRAPKHGLRGA